jgi:purine-binding chemotaxis protein CheW
MTQFNGTGALESSRSRRPGSLSGTLQFATFYVEGRLDGIEVRGVQEVVKPMPMTRIPLSPPYITGLINLRGQIATAIGVRELFGIEQKPTEALMNIVCKAFGVLLSFQVDEIGDVLEVSRDDFENVPTTVGEHVRQFLGGVYKVNDSLLSVIDVEPVGKYLGLMSSKASEQ